MKTQRNAGGAEAQPPFSPSELNFTDSDRLPTEELRFCLNYECARSNPIFVTGVWEERKSRSLSSFAARISSSGPCWQLYMLLAHHVREFPATPWQDIPPKRREKILKLAPERGWEGLRDWGSLPVYEEKRQFIRELGQLNPEYIFLLEIDFHEHPTFIHAKFQTWLEQKRRELQLQFPESAESLSPSIERRGRNGKHRNWKDRLQLLSNYRRLQQQDEQVYAEDADRYRYPKKLRELLGEFAWEQPSDSWTFAAKDFKDLPAFLVRLKQRTDGLSAILWDRLSEETRQGLAAHEDSKSVPKPLCNALAEDITRIIKGEPLDEDKRFARVKLPEGTREEIAGIHAGGDHRPANRRILEAGFPSEISKQAFINQASGFIL